MKIYNDNNSVITIEEKYNCTPYNEPIELLEATFRVMIKKAFELTRKYKIYSYDMFFIVNDTMLNKLCCCKIYNAINNYIYLKDIDLKIEVNHNGFICHDIIELRIVSKDEIKYEEKNDMGDKNENMTLYGKDGDIGYYWDSIPTIIYRSPEIKNVIKKVIFSGPCTIVLWSDNTKTIVRCVDEDFDKEKGLAMAISKKFLGTNKNKSNYFDVFKKWCKEEK